MLPVGLEALVIEELSALDADLAYRGPTVGKTRSPDLVPVHAVPVMPSIPPTAASGTTAKLTITGAYRLFWA